MPTEINILAAIDLWDIGLSLGLFAAVALAIIAVFGQRGEVQLSFQRQSAIEHGYSDRRTIFENMLLRPVLWLLLSLATRLSAPRFKDWLRRTLVASGNPNFFTPEEYITLAAFNGLLLGLGLELVWLLVKQSFAGTWLLIGVVLGFAFTLVQLHSRSSARVRQISRKVPYSLDLISLAMGAGATFTEAVRTVAREDKEDPFNVELNTMLTEIDLGSTRRKSLLNLADRIPLDPLKTIIASVVQAEELGTPLHDVLHSQASLLRLQRTVRAENAAAVASVRILVPSLLILFGVVLTLFGPAIIRFISNGGLF